MFSFIISKNSSTVNDSDKNDHSKSNLYYRKEIKSEAQSMNEPSKTLNNLSYNLSDLLLTSKDTLNQSGNFIEIASKNQTFSNSQSNLYHPLKRKFVNLFTVPDETLNVNTEE